MTNQHTHTMLHTEQRRTQLGKPRLQGAGAAHYWLITQPGGKKTASLSAAVKPTLSFNHRASDPPF